MFQLKLANQLINEKSFSLDWHPNYNLEIEKV